MRRLARIETMLASTVAGSALFLALVAGGAGCTLGVDTEDDGGDAPGDGNPPPPGDDGLDVATAAIYTRGTLAPVFKLIQPDDANRINIQGRVLNTGADFITPGGGFFTLEDMLDNIADQIVDEGGEAVNLIPFANDRNIASQTPFRGHPTDVKQVLDLNGARKILVPLGGDIDKPGNEVAILDRADPDSIELVRVGAKPVRIQTHEDGIAFVCSQYSNYISVIDVTDERVLTRTDGTAVEIPTEFYCTDILLAEKVIGGEFDSSFYLLVANEWRGAVMRYDVSLVQDGVNDRVIDVVIDNPGNPISTPQAYITGVGPNPIRLKLSESQEEAYVFNGRGGLLARVDIDSGSVLGTHQLNAPAMDGVQVEGDVFVTTTMPDRGLLAEDDITPLDAQQDRVLVTGVDGNQQEAHPGALFDRTKGYNFDDMRSGVQDLNFDLGEQTFQGIYFTDNTDADANIDDQQRVLSGAAPVAIERNEAGDRIFLGHSASRQIQELEVQNGQFRLVEIAGAVFETDNRPTAMVVDEENNELLVANWGKDTLTIFDLQNRNLLEQIDLSYANLNTAAESPSSVIEIGEVLYYDAEWSNDGRKTCHMCHGPDNLIADGFGYGNGATAPTAQHGIRPNFNLPETDNYFWVGTFNNGSYASLAFAAQTRTTCEQQFFATVEGPESDPDNRQGDPENVARGFGAVNNDCNPQPVDVATGLPANFDAFQVAANQQKQDRKDDVVNAAILIGGAAADLIPDPGGDINESFTNVSRFIDFYSVSSVRLPPNALKKLYENGDLSSEDKAKIDRGKTVYEQAACNNCHDANNTNAPYIDGLQHGSGSTWNQDFFTQYQNDDRVVFPDPFIQALQRESSANDSEINIHTTLDDFQPFCFDVNNCLLFEDPLAVTGDDVEESRRLNIINVFNLNDPERGFNPGNIKGNVRINTPSLRSIWWNAGYLHHGLARTIHEATLGPGHPALRAGERGWAISSGGAGQDPLDSHGVTKQLSPDDVDAMVLYLETLE
jgi:Di-haem cytochrome c peroxidase